MKINTSSKKLETKHLTSKINSIKNTLKAALLSVLMLAPNISNTQNMNPGHPLSPINPLNPNNPVSPNSPLHLGRWSENISYKDINLETIKNTKFDTAFLWISAEKTATIEKDFDAFFTEIIEEEGNFSGGEIFSKITEIGKKYNLNPEEMEYIFMHYLQNIVERKEYSTFMWLLKTTYTQEEIQKKIDNVLNYKWDLSFDEVCKQEFSEIYQKIKKTNIILWSFWALILGFFVWIIISIKREEKRRKKNR